jgi:serine/threonine protein kinase
VYRAQDLRSGDEIALKLLSTGSALDPLAAKRLAREFETLYALNHPNVVRVFDAGVHHGYPYLAMELVEGLDLRRYLLIDSQPVVVLEPRDEEDSALGLDDSDSVDEVPAFQLESLWNEEDTDALGRSAHGHHAGADAIRELAEAAGEENTDEDDDVALPFEPAEPPPAPAALALPPSDLEALNRPERVARMKDALLQLCEALAYVHARGLVHRDVKPANVMVDDDRRVRLMDFGLAKFLASDHEVTGAGHVVGTYRYMSPEQLQAEPLDARADLYSLGVVIYELLTGRVPYGGKTPLDLWNQVLANDPLPVTQLNPDADAQLARVAHRLMRKEPSERYQTAEEVFQALME